MHRLVDIHLSNAHKHPEYNHKNHDFITKVPALDSTYFFCVFSDFLFILLSVFILPLLRPCLEGVAGFVTDLVKV